MSTTLISNLFQAMGVKSEITRGPRNMKPVQADPREMITITSRDAIDLRAIGVSNASHLLADDVHGREMVRIFHTRPRSV